MNKWYDSEFSNMSIMKYDLYKISIQSGHWDAYNIIKKQYIKIKNTENKINIKANNSREMWKYLENWLTEQRGEIKTVKINGIIYDNDQEISDILNKCLVNSAKEISESIEQYEYRGLYTDVNNGMDQFRFKMVSSNEICVILKKLKYKIGVKTFFRKVYWRTL